MSTRTGSLDFGSRSSIENVILDNKTTDPSVVAAGLFYYNTVTGYIRYCNGGAWMNIEHQSNRVNVWSDVPSTIKYPSEKLTKDSLDTISLALSTHNHNLNDLAEKSYNSLDDLPSLNFEPANDNIQSHIGDGDIHVTSSEKSTWSGKQDSLSFSTNIETDKASTTKVSAIKTFYDWAVGKFIDLTKIVTTWTATTLNTNIPSEKLVKDSLDLKADISPANGSTSALRALFIARGYYKATNTYYCVYNSTSGYYEMNGLTDITEDEMLNILIASLSLETNNHASLNQGYNSKPTRTLYPISWKNNYAIDARSQFQTNTAIQVYKTTQMSGNYPDYNYPDIIFYGCTNLRIIDGMRLRNITSVVRVDSMLFGCVNLETVNLQHLKVSFSFAWSPLLSLESLQYLVTNRANDTTIITITVHATVMAKLTSTDPQYADWNALWATALTTHYIAFAS